ncbi:DUF5665 domain-containing protein [Paenibacillus sp. P26]|nr:DUF5665 domain-containing protein [Paenibacillus sp. P26]UUZ96071.1 DUF5665 domain-containing protein [Paenibacillus sp. P25]
MKEPNDEQRLQQIHEKVQEIAANIERTQIADYVALMNRPRRLLWINFWTGISRGVGIAVGFTIFASVILYVLRALGALNLPIIGGFIADIVKHVQYQLEGRGY